MDPQAIIYYFFEADWLEKNVFINETTDLIEVDLTSFINWLLSRKYE